MMHPPASTYSPVVDPRDLSSVPGGLRPNDELHVPVRAMRQGLRPPSWLRQLRRLHRVVTSFCVSDHDLLRWDSEPGRAERFVAALRPAASLTLDVPYYQFMPAGARERALARSCAAISRAHRMWEPQSIETVPLIKGLQENDWAPQLDLAAGLGLGRVAQYVREQRLENDDRLITRFVDEARRRRLRPVLVGCFRPRARWGPLDAAALQHYVLARHGRMLGRSGRPRALGEGAYSDVLGRFLVPRDVAGLNMHNFHRARAGISRRGSLSDFGIAPT